MTNRNVDRGSGVTQADASFEILRDPHRRSVCRYVSRTETPIVTRAELVDYVAERASDAVETDGETDPRVARRRVATQLRHVHLPKLDDFGIVEYDPDRETISVDREALATHLERARGAIADLQDPLSEQ